MSIFPFIDFDAAETPSPLPVFREYAYDFEKNELKRDKDGKTYLVEKNEALRIWIFKALSTERFHYTAHSEAYGEEFTDQLIGHSLERETAELELERYLTEALMVNPYIQKLDNFSFESNSNKMYVEFDCISIYGAERLRFPLTEGL